MIASGQDFRETGVYKQSLKLGLISNRDEGAAPSPIPPGAETREAIFQISGMWCTSCAWLIEHVLGKQRGVISANVLFTSDLARIRYCPLIVPRERLSSAIAGLGYRASEYTGLAARESAETRDLLLRIGVAAFLWLNVMSLSLVLYAGYFERISDSVAHILPFVLLGLTSVAVCYCARPILRVAWFGLRHRAVRMEGLLAVGILAAYAYSAAQTFAHGSHFYFDTTCALIALVLAGKLAERGAKEKTIRAVATLYRMMPTKVRLLAERQERFVNIDALQPGAVFVVKAGERIPADGIVEAGFSHVDESVLTGEPVPRGKKPGDEVVCGSLNADSVLEIRATRVGADSTLTHIVRLVENALANRSPIERTVDHAARIFVPCVMALALLTCGGVLAVTANPGAALMRAITVLVIACPCALGMATPLAITTAIGAASRKGILVSNSRALEVLPKVNTIVLDKTGTVTEGEFRLLETVGNPGALPLAAALETFSEHPLGRALVRWAEQQGWQLPAPRNVQVEIGAGIRGQVQGREVFVGNRRMTDIPFGIDTQARAWEQQGYT
ncbi:MAG TPA: cation-translocating P-type ATPase, partial [Dyella sp.]|nr:cation-translocating P-type ATPase [Dyella sp.]